MRFLASCFATFALAVATLGQTFYGSLVGNVTDSSGASVAQANVTLVNTATGDRRSMQSGGDGVYQFVNLPPGQYRVEMRRYQATTTSRDR